MLGDAQPDLAPAGEHVALGRVVVPGALVGPAELREVGEHDLRHRVAERELVRALALIDESDGLGVELELARHVTPPLLGPNPWVEAEWARRPRLAAGRPP